VPVAAPDGLTWPGHGTALVGLDAVRLLVDPVLTGWVGPLRNTAPALPAPLLAGVDAVLVSHVHRDHLDRPSLARLPAGTRVLAPRGAAPLLDGVAGPVEELDVGDASAVGALTVRATPARHEAVRAGRRVPALGFLVTGGRTVYLAGDTDLFPGMADVAAAAPGGLDAAVLPVGGWGLTLGAGHLDPVRAACALRLLRPRLALPVHYGTLRLPGVWRLRPGLVRDPGRAFARHAAGTAPDVTVRVVAPGGGVRL
jgi:L-ascorbate metabolism protein UlaG (beta-lactamase superfamily)